MVTEKTDGHKSTISKLTDWEKKEGLVVVASLFDIKKILRLLHKRPFIIAKSTKRLLGEEGEKFSVRRIREVLQKAGYKSMHAARKPLLTERMKL